jgi:putative transposase
MLAETARQEPGITVDTLRKRVEASYEATDTKVGVVADAINILVLQQKLYVDLLQERLTEPDRAHVFPDQALAKAYGLMAIKPATDKLEATWPATVTIQANAALLWDGRLWTVANLGATKTALLSNNEGSVDVMELPNETLLALIQTGRILAPPSPAPGDPTAPARGPAGQTPEARARLMKASARSFGLANERFAELAPFILEGGLPEGDSGLPRSTRSRLLLKYREAAADPQYRCGYIGLLPSYSNCGRRGPRYGERTMALLDEAVKTHYETPEQTKKRAAYALFQTACEREGVACPSYQFFSDWVDRRPVYEQTLKRKGKRGAYKDEPFYWELEYTLPRHGSRPWDVGYLDHTQADTETVDSKGNNIGRPWVTLLGDGNSRRVFAVYASLDAPSRASDMMTLRECVRRFGRLPQTLVVDGGCDFRSIYFDRLLALYEVIRNTRPGAKPRYGTVIERLFGTANTEFFHNLRGNPQATRDPRQLTPEVNPKGRAVWTLDELYKRLREWAYTRCTILKSIQRWACPPARLFLRGYLYTETAKSKLYPTTRIS